MSKRPTHADTRRKALEDARAEIRAEILLEPWGSIPNILERITKILDRMIESGR